MPISNVERITFFIDNYYFNNAPDDGHFHFEKFQDIHGFEPQGLNWYIGLTSSKKQQIESENSNSGGTSSLTQWDIRFLEDFYQWLLASEEKEKCIIFALEPNDVNTFAFVGQHLAWIEGIAKQLKSYADKAAGKGKTLKFVIRFASEMNDVGSQGTNWNKPGMEHLFINAYREVRHVFKSVSEEFLFCFSPALRRDMAAQNFAKYQRIKNYWPGDDQVDVVSGTWYIGAQDDLPLATAALDRYFSDFGKKGAVLMGLDEFGVSNGTETKDALLKQMCQELSNLKAIKPFYYATFFLGKNYGVNAPLAFVKTGS